MALFLTEGDVQQVLTMPMAITAIEEVLREVNLGLAVNIPRQRTRVPKGALHILQGAVESQQVIGYKAYTSTREGNRFLLHLYDSNHGNLQAVIEANYLGMIRTGAASGVASKWLSRNDSTTVGLFGSGWQATGQLEALCCVRPISRVKVMARNAERLNEFCRHNSDRLGISVEPYQDAEQVVRNSDIVTTVTTAAEPLVHFPWVEEGTHLNAVGSNALIRREIDEKTIRNCNLVTVDSRDVAANECGDLLPLIEKGRLNWRQVVELGDIIAGQVSGRTANAQITLFESQGMAVQDLMLGKRILAAAQAKGLGKELPFGN
ncbi:ornithine cyclodeaminase [Syntrophotalea acetylenivorans]|uniref:Ornithine cyclodeaminase n=1 Tax=Syntrophotalea acetylenivorans TaxID=1842532 RepID=A0A1L3GNX5_9BACT|nr:ornithine cyclodeaminase family protein [Syntrophotalea acetylenivorans]APG27633.1 ornithine cyclodeaminase [Syntrophotalea acetylenivorans]